MDVPIWECTLTDIGLCRLLSIGGSTPQRRVVEIPFREDAASARAAAALLFMLDGAGDAGNRADAHSAPAELCVTEAVECRRIQ
ncbi:MAG: hypothetical protein ACQERG_01740 [Pseudomonadota bacterium]